MSRITAARPATLLVLLAVLLLPAGLSAQTHPNHAQGFEPQKAYQVGDIENVNLFNGNLNLTLPLGPRFPIGGEMSYGLTLVYSGNVWEWEEDYLLGPNGYEYYLKAMPRKRSNAGLGWRLTLGEMNPPQSVVNNSPRPAYESADGALHELWSKLHDDLSDSDTYSYTHDGTYLRYDSSARTMEFPDGTIQRFDSSDRLIEMEDRFGNGITVSYLTSPTRWRIVDNHGRTQTVYFQSAAYYGAGSTVDKVVVTAFGGATATYDFQYTETDVVRGYTNAYAVSQDLISRTVRVPLLSAVVLPDGSKYSMPLSDYDLGPASGTSNLSGHLVGMRLPTWGRMEWQWMEYLFPKASGAPVSLRNDTDKLEGNNPFIQSTGLARRWHKDRDGSALGDWTYQQLLDPDLRWKEHRMVVTDPLGHPTTYYFSVYKNDLDPNTPEPSGWYEEEYGLPFSRKTGDGSGTGRYISAEIKAAGGSKKRTVYLRYERSSTYSEANRRLASKRTVFHDDGNRYKDVTHSDFDGAGHYRTTTTGGNYPAGNVRTVTTNYNPGQCASCTPSGAWVLDTFTERTVTEGGDTAKTEYCFESSTGFLSRTRTLANGTSRSSKDVIARYTRDAAGNVTAEESFGGDTQGVGTGSLCGLSLPYRQYRADHTYQYGTRRTSQYSGVGHKSLDRDVDYNTGLVRASRDSAGLSTGYDYDSMGRLTYEKPSQGGWTRYEYWIAGSGSPAQVQIKRQSNGGWTDLAWNQLRFDGLGRLEQEKILMPDGSWSTKETIYDHGGNVASESVQGNTTSRTDYLGYDPFGRPSTIRPPDGSAHDVSLSYAGDRVVTRTEKVGTARDGSTGAILESSSSTTTTYDGQGRIYQVFAPDNADGSTTTVTYSYDVGGRLSRVDHTAKGSTGWNTPQTRLFDYDERGFLVSERHPEKGSSGNGTVYYGSYDSRGHAGSVTDGANTLRFVYDPAERLTKVEESLGFGLYRPLKSFTYATTNATSDWKKGKLWEARRYNYPVLGTTEYTAEIYYRYTYGGKQGRVSERETGLTFEGNTNERWYQDWTWNDLGEVASVGYPECAYTACTTPSPRTVGYGYSNGFLTSVGGYASSISYHPNGMWSTISRANGTTDNQQVFADGMARPKRINTYDGGYLRWQTGLYAYDGAGNVTKQGNAYFLYDKANRIKDGLLYLGAGAGGSATSFAHAYDGFGNLTSITTATGRSISTDSATNRLSGSVSYDASGNLTSWNGNSYEYDALDMMKRVASAEAWLYMYDADDERVWSFEESANPRFDRFTLRDLDGRVLRTYEATGFTGWTVERDYVYRGSQLLVAETPEGIRHLHADHLGTPRAVTNLYGTRVDYHVYYPFGEEATAVNQNDERMKFTGHERDLGDPTSAADDLDYMHARYYNPQLGRFLSVDPVGADRGLPQSWNRYSYVLGNPLKYIDPYGLVGDCPPNDSLTCNDSIPRGFFDFVAFGTLLRNPQLLFDGGPSTGFGLFDVSTAQRLFRTGFDDAAGEGKDIQAFVLFAVDALFVPESQAELGVELGMAVVPGGKAGRALTKSFKYAVKKLGVNGKTASKALHAAKRAAGRGGADNVLFDTKTGNIIEPETGEIIGNLTDAY